MTTIPDSIKAQLDADWTGAGGTEPSYYVQEDYRSNPPLGKDAVWVLSYTLTTEIRPVNDTYADHNHLIDLIVNTATSEDRLKELADEVARILNATAISGATYQRIRTRKNISDRSTFNYQERMTVDVREQLAATPAAYGAGASADWFLDEDDMASDCDTCVASQQSIKAYTDNSITTHAGVTDAHHTKYTDAEAIAAVVAENPLALTNGLTVGGDASLTGDLTVSGGNVGIGAAPSASYVLYGYKESSCESRLKSNTGDSFISLQGATNYDAGVVMMEGASNRIAMYYDASLNKYSFYNYVSAKTLALKDTGVLDYNGTATFGDVVTLDSGGDNITSTNLADLSLFGTGNAAWVPCMFSGDSASSDKFRVNSTTTAIANVDGTDADLRFDVPLPTVKGALKLYIKGTRVVIYDADADAYVNTTTVFGYTHTGVTALDSDATNKDAQGTHDDAFTAVDCSSYSGVLVWLNCVVDALNELDVLGVFVHAYYA